MNCTCGTCNNCKAKLAQPSPQFNNGGGVGQPQMTFEQFNAGQHTPIYTGQQPPPIQQPLPVQVAPPVETAPITNVAPTEVDPEWAWINDTVWELLYVGLEDPEKIEIITEAPKLITNQVTPTVVEPTPSVPENTEVTP